jgi:hypothetical protein
MSLDHQTEVKHAILGQIETTDLTTKHDTSNNSSSRRTKTTTERNGVDNVNMSLGRESVLVVASQNIEGSLSDQIAVSNEVDALFAETFVGNLAVGLVLGRLLGGVYRNTQLEPDRKSQTDDIKTGAWSRSQLTSRDTRGNW